MIRDRIQQRWRTGSRSTRSGVIVGDTAGKKTAPLTASLSLFNILVISASRRATQECCLCTRAGFQAVPQPRGTIGLRAFCTRVRATPASFEVSVSSGWTAWPPLPRRLNSATRLHDGLIILVRDRRGSAGGWFHENRRLYIEQRYVGRQSLSSKRSDRYDLATMPGERKVGVWYWI